MALPLAAVTLVLAVQNGRVDMNGHAYGNPVLFFGGAAAGIAMILAIAPALSGARALSRIGRNAAAIFPTHLPFFSLLTALAVLVFCLPRTFNDRSIFVGLGYTAVSLVFLTPLGEWLRVSAPWLIGESAPLRSRASGTD
jgi:hypothetical protein